MNVRFRDRAEAGRLLAERLAAYRHQQAVVLALPRGGVVVANEVARALSLPLDVLIVRKLGAPMERELAIGAVAEGGVRFIDERIALEVGATREEIEDIAARELREIERRVRLWRGGRPPASLQGRVAIVVDDGIATGSTVRVALRALHMNVPARIVLAVPVAAASTLASLREEVDEVVCLAEPTMMWAISELYENFEQVSDEAVTDMLKQAADAEAMLPPEPIAPPL